MALPLLGSTLVRARRTARLAVLGLTPEASEVEIRRAYLDLVQVWHPDRFEHNPGLKQRAQDTLQAINDAYAGLAGDRVPADPQLFDVRHAPVTPRGRQTVAAGTRTRRRRQRSARLEHLPLWARETLSVVPYAVLAAVALGTVWLVDSAAAPARKPEPAFAMFPVPAPGVPDQPAFGAPSAAPANLAGAVDACDGAALRPRSGTEFGGERRPGHGTLTLTNDADRDALAMLSDVALDRPRRAVYVRSGETAVMGAVASGTYRLRYQFGDVWLDEGRFCHPERTTEVDAPLQYEERPTPDGMLVSAVTVALRAGPDPTPGLRFREDRPLALPRD